MPKFLITASYTNQGVKGLLKDGGSSRRAVVQKQGILRSRPKLNPWTLKFDLLVIDEDIPRDLIPALREGRWARCESSRSSLLALRPSPLAPRSSPKHRPLKA